MDQPELPPFFYEIFDSSLPRLGPGDDGSTRKALEMVYHAAPHLKRAPNAAKLRVLDIGCGNGAQTLLLAKLTDAMITAVDNHQPYLDELTRRARAAGVSEKIQTCRKDMRALGMDRGSFDLIWAEGSLFVMGFREGLLTCHDLLIPSGCLAASELCWLRSDPPSECREYFANEYPAIVDIETNMTTIRNSGYEVVGHFTHPESAWWVPYYQPLEIRLRSLLEKHSTDPTKIELIESIKMEIDMYRKYSRFYGNVFYVMQRR